MCSDCRCAGKPLCSAPGFFLTRAGQTPEQVICSESLGRGTWPLFLLRHWTSTMWFFPMYINHGNLLENNFCE